VQVLARILSARWFRRAWCSHELQLGTDFAFLIPAGNGVLELTMDSLEVLYSVNSDYAWQDEELFGLLADTYLSYDFLTRAMDSISKESLGKSLMSAFSDIFLLECSVQTDKICIALNTANLQLYFMGQDKSSDEFRWLLAMIALSAGDGTALCGVDDLIKLDGDKDRSSYTWLNWSDDGQDTMELMGTAKLREPSGITTVDQYQITLDLLDVGSCNIMEPSDISLSCADAVLAICAEWMAKRELVNQPFWLQPSYSRMDRVREQHFFMETLACSLDCGLDWMMKQMTFHNSLAEKVQRSLEDDDIDLWSLLGSLLIARGLTNEGDWNNFPDQTRKSLLQYFYYIIFDHPLDVGSMRPSYINEESKARAEKGKLVRCVWLDMGTSGKAW
jgi:hypothetical protein